MEIERKFLVDKEKFDLRIMTGVDPTILRQGYLSLDKERTVRVRTVKHIGPLGYQLSANEGFITVKGVTVGISRAEYEYEIPFNEADEMLAICHQPLIEKTRYSTWIGGSFWEIDIFSGDNEGLIVAEIELETESAIFHLPSFLGKEVSHDHRYYNSSLMLHPYTQWFDGAYE